MDRGTNSDQQLGVLRCSTGWNRIAQRRRQYVVDRWSSWLQRLGNVFAFTRGGKIWSQGSELTGSNVQAGEGFGAVVAISGDASAAIVGVPWDNLSVARAGSVRMYSLGLQNGRVVAGSGELTISAFNIDLQGTLSAASVNFAPSSIMLRSAWGRSSSVRAYRSRTGSHHNSNLKFSAANSEIGITSPITRVYPTNLEFSAGVNYLGFYGVNSAWRHHHLCRTERWHNGDILSVGGQISILADTNNDGIGELTVVNNFGGVGNINAGNRGVVLHAAQYVNNATGTIVGDSIVVLGSRDTTIELGPLYSSNQNEPVAS